MRLKDHQRSIRIVLNKADQVDKAKLRRVSGWVIGMLVKFSEIFLHMLVRRSH